MKKIIVAIIAFLYLSVSSGIAMEIHYCMGKKAGIDFYGSDDGKCGRCGMKDKKSGCCNDEHKFYKLNDSHKNVSNNISFETIDHPVIISHSVFESEVSTALYLNTLHTHSPPHHTRPSACILNCVFRL